MINIRRSVFETNSSSTHSITIVKNNKNEYKYIPRNLETTYKVEEYGDVGGSDERYAVNKHRDEVDKLRYIINMIASFYEGKDNDWDYKRKDDKKYFEESFKQLINKDLFVWLKEVVKEETGTEIEYVKPTYNWYPFFETTYSDDEDIEYLLCIKENLDGINKEIFKDRVKDIIFNKDIIIENKNIPYGMED